MTLNHQTFRASGVRTIFVRRGDETDFYFLVKRRDPQVRFEDTTRAIAQNIKKKNKALRHDDDNV